VSPLLQVADPGLVSSLAVAAVALYALVTGAGRAIGALLALARRYDVPEVLIGSNVVNPLLGIGLGGVVSTYHVPTAVVVWDLPFKLVTLVGLGLYARYRDGALERRVGVSLIGLYFLYVVGRMLLFPGS
jgi:cation:H+ antiporter